MLHKSSGVEHERDARFIAHNGFPNGKVVQIYSTFPTAFAKMLLTGPIVVRRKI